jgi:hypothetical protein
MKHAYMRWSKEARAVGIPYWWINWVHDEWQTETVLDGARPEWNGKAWVIDHASPAYHLASLQREAITHISQQFELNCRMDGESKFGFNWLETH